MKIYLELVERVLREGTVQENRTGIDTIRIEGAQLEFDMRVNFPLVTTRQIFTKGGKGELVGFINAFDNAAQFRALGCNLWNANANENEQWLANPNRKGTDDLGRIYGVQWRQWRKYDGTLVDQLKNAIDTIMTSPTSRRIIVNAWNPGELELMALPPCHTSFQLITDPRTRELSLRFEMRSCDVVLGLPTNIFSYAALLEMIAGVTGYRAKKLIAQLSDVHIYMNHIDGLNVQLTRPPLALPTCKIKLDYNKAGIEMLEAIMPDDIIIDGYEHHPLIKFPMAV